ncbi:MAG: hypothetical protein QOE44_656 [Solirubrobacteraceae bacterium]|jgi:acetyltransferase-like isoleucine patch superfamily enzyme|nr:hypothetical protein [Solirubrobacteraceae bacterium]
MNALAGYRRLCGARDLVFSRAVARSFASCGEGTVIHLPVKIEGERRIRLGRGVSVGPGSWLVAHADRGAELAIGDRTAISGHCVLAAAHRVTVGAGVLMARGVLIVDHNHGRAPAGVAIRDSGLSEIAPVSIGDGCWLGQNVVVLPGVTIGRGAVVAANSVVREDVPAGAVAAGVPARVVGRRDG